MTAPTFDQPIPPEPWTPRRVLIGLGGLLLLVVGTVITLGVALIGVAAIVIAWLVMRKKSRPLTRVRAWMVSVVATVVPLLVVFVIGLESAPAPTAAQRRSAMAEQARRRDSMPEWLKKLAPAQRQTAPVADSIADRLFQHRGFVVWLDAMVAMLGSCMIGAFAGTLGWGATMLLFRSFQGDWMGRSAPPLLR